MLTSETRALSAFKHAPPSKHKPFIGTWDLGFQGAGHSGPYATLQRYVSQASINNLLGSSSQIYDWPTESRDSI
ncbi:hypothetical protein AB205_0212270 [Aquarana catesbeiana]|uniref:Uncharacterized protein n=1 Tax=Aquarana catesbeiana TaxID=8400 RepID=A0A2G9RA17_AQUCT|nr:hypothetical protein AB205_0212270 [Aquarana catesbeiana]